MGLLLVCASAQPAEAPPESRIPVIMCPVNDEVGAPRALPGESMSAPVQPSAVDQLVYYKAEHSPGLFAPKGWACRAWFGSSGSLVVVTPKRLEPPYFPLPKIAGPAVMIQTSDLDGPGRFRVAIVSTQLFPMAGTELISRVRDEHLISDASFDAEPLLEDRVQYLTDRLAEYTTAANRSGLGTDSVFEVSNLPVRGLTLLTPTAGVNSLTEVRVRVGGGSGAVEEGIMQLETACLQLQRGCHELR